MSLSPRSFVVYFLFVAVLLLASFKQTRLTDNYAPPISQHDNNIENSVTTKKELSVSIIPILSGQRSSSTYLAYKIMDTMHCHLSINEVLFKEKRQSDDAWDVEATQLGFADQPNAKTVDPDVLAEFVIQVSKRKCKAFLDKHPLMARQCNNHCWVNYKHFNIHLNAWQHQMMWDSLIQKTSSSGNSGIAMAVLERDVRERWRSTWYAENSGDWAVMGDAKHRERVKAANVPPMEKKFWYDHSDWYEMIRGYAKIINKRRQNKNDTVIPVMEFKYDTLVQQPVADVQAYILEAIEGKAEASTTAQQQLEDPQQSTN